MQIVYKIAYAKAYFLEQKNTINLSSAEFTLPKVNALKQ